MKPKDYEQQGEVSAANEYEAWAGLRASGQALDVGDLLEVESGDLRICKYVGFEPASWIVPEPVAPPAPLPDDPPVAHQA